MARAYHAERDAEGLQLAVRELFEESYFAEATRALLAKVDEESRERILLDQPERTLSPGYYDRAAYILGLGAAVECGVTYFATQLTRDDVMGLQAAKQAKGQFERDHPPCPACGTRQDNRWMNKCKSCQTKFAGRGD